MGKEAYDDYQRHVRDKEANSFRYLILDRNIRLDTVDDPETHLGMALTRSIPAAAIKAGDLVVLEKNMRIPADMILLRTTEGAGSHRTMVASNVSGTVRSSELVDIDRSAHATQETSLPQAEEEGGSCFVRTDQLDGETDWKVKMAVPRTQGFSNRELLSMRGELYGEAYHVFFPLTSYADRALPDDIISGSSDEGYSQLSRELDGGV